MSSPLIFIPKKQTQDIDFTPYLRSIIQRTYGESPDNYSEAMGALNRARQDALRGVAGSDSTGRDLLLKYFGMLEWLELKFTDLRVPFPWIDAFTLKTISQLSLAYEKASVIFNIGSTLSSLGSTTPRTSPEGLKRAIYAFRCASGMFTYINDNFLHAPSTDLSREVVKVLVVLMTAQGTELVVEMTKGSGLKAKLCMSVASAYAGIVEEVKEWVGKAVFIKEWSALVQTKAKYYLSLAQYHRSIADTTALSYGIALSRLILSESLAKEAHKLSQTFTSTFSPVTTPTSLALDSPVTLLELTKAHLALVTEKKLIAQKENDLVYNEIVPSETSLPTIEKAKDVSLPIPIQELYASPEVQKIVGPDLFVKLVPLGVHESASMYSEEKAKLVRAEVERCEVGESEMVTSLEYLGLPKGLERFTSSSNGSGVGDVGGVVRGWSEELNQSERQESIPAGFKKLFELKSRAGTALERIARDLESEGRECEKMRVKYGHLWEQTPSSSLTKSFRQDIKSHQNSLQAAAGSDEQATSLYQSIQADIQLLLSPGDLERTFEQLAEGGNGRGSESLLDLDMEGGDDEKNERSKLVGGIEEALKRLREAGKERKDTLRDLKDKVQNDDISSQLILNRKGTSALDPTIFITELEKFKPYQTRITTTLQHQQTLLSSIIADFKTLNDSPSSRKMQDSWKGAERRKKSLIDRLGSSKEAYEQVLQGIRKGTQFYGDLLSLVEGLEEQVDGFLRSRKSEAGGMIAGADLRMRLEGPRVSSPAGSDFDRRMGSMDLGSGGRSPQPYPQPPSPHRQESWSSPPPPPQQQYQPSYSSPPVQVASYSPAPAAPPPSNPYGNFPDSGAVSTSTAPPPSNQYNAARSPPPAPPSMPSYSPAPYQAQRQASYPPPPPPTSYSSQPTGNQASYLPPPPAPVSYSSYQSQSVYSQAPPVGYQPPHGGYGAPQPQQQQQQHPGQGQYAQPPPQQNGYGYTSPPPPPPPGRPNYY